jgi:hypothetical protein
LKYFWLTAVLFCTLISATAQTTRDATHLVPSGKGWGHVVPEARPPRIWGAPQKGAPTNGIFYHGGPVMGGTVNLYFIWYGNFLTGPTPSDSVATQDLLTTLFSTGGLGGTAYARINSTYSDRSRAVTGKFALMESANDYYSRGAKLNDAAVTAVVAQAVSNGALPKDVNGVYFVLSSSDVSETSGFCTRYCGWHSHATISGSDIKIAFVGNPDRCPNACEEQTVSPNGDSGADGMASIMAHETNEAISDPDLNAWYDTSGNENGDKCVWKWGPVTGSLGNGAYNTAVAGHHWLIQMNWENARGGGCDQKLSGKFYSQ